MKKKNTMIIVISLVIFSIIGVINGVAYELDPGPPGGPTHTSHTVSTTHTYELQFIDAFTNMVDSETVTVTLSIKYDYYSSSNAYYYTYYSFDVSIEDTDTWLSRVNFDTYVLKLAGNDIVYTSKDVLQYYDGWSTSGSISSTYNYDKLDIWFGIYTTCSISGDQYECEYITTNKGTSNSGWTYYFGNTYLGNFDDVSHFLIFEYV